MQRDELGYGVILAISGTMAERDQRRSPNVRLAVLRLVAHWPDRQIDGTIDFAEAGAALTASRAIDDGEKTQSSGRRATLAVTIAKRQLYPLIIELALDGPPFLPQRAGENSGNRKAEWLRGTLGELR